MRLTGTKVRGLQSPIAIRVSRARGATPAFGRRTDAMEQIAFAVVADPEHRAGLADRRRIGGIHGAAELLVARAVPDRLHVIAMSALAAERRRYRVKADTALLSASVVHC